jgi:hypothetical protein
MSPNDFIKSHVFDRNDPKMGDFHMKRMFLYPKMWADFSLPSGVSLSWNVMRFGDDNSEHVFNSYGGVYSFVVQPEIALHPLCSYLLYVGRTKRHFRARYQEYVRDLNKDPLETRRPHVTVMLQKWEKYLWYCYARVDGEQLIKQTETALISAYLPPTNKDLPGALQQAVDNIILGN